MREPSEIPSMAELRAEIDALDLRLVALLAERARFIDRAAQLKPGEGMPARITARVEEVVANAKAAAEARGLDPALVEAIWRMMVEWSIAREEAVLGKGEAD
ncbi:chorismate mutase [Rhodobacter aestuarii]|uniref:chorismate mutase n=1 Tax=Rhodobacter aestuarii TaxID=453582 RepID=A0A1N7Q5Z3_9RHOB|nr:chorismate mutase [Rhodobacter aestuarii]PTV93864.1 chorismate mutase [Rhodobacter aestuarii]SIT18265.1 chorismate mutase [Rhodobacter aestuarii]